MTLATDYFAGETTIFVWPRERPQERRVLTEKDTTGKPNPLFALARELVNLEAAPSLGCFLRHDAGLDVLAEAHAVYCAEKRIPDGTVVGKQALDLARRLSEGDPHELVRWPNPFPELPFVAMWGELQGLLEE